MMPSATKKRRLSKKKNRSRTEAHPMMYCDNILGLIISLLTTKEYVCTLSLTSIFHYNFLKKSSNIQIVKQMLIREFSTKLIELYFSASYIVRCIHFLYNMWMDKDDWYSYNKCLYYHILIAFNPTNKNYQDIMQNPSNQQLIEKFNESTSKSILYRMEAFPNRVETFIYWITQIMKNCDDIANIDEFTMDLVVANDETMELHIISILAIHLMEHCNEWPTSTNSNVFANYLKFVRWCKNTGYRFNEKKIYYLNVWLDTALKYEMSMEHRYEWLCVAMSSYCDDLEHLMNKIKRIKKRMKNDCSYKHLGRKKMKETLITLTMIFYRNIINGLHQYLCCDTQIFNYIYIVGNVDCNNDQQRELQKLTNLLIKYDVIHRLQDLNKFTKMDRNKAVFHHLDTENYEQMDRAQNCLIFLNTISNIMQLKK